LIAQCVVSFSLSKKGMMFSIFDGVSVVWFPT
jgi:hypothetical protein